MESYYVYFKVDMQTDVVICGMPYVASGEPLMAPAVLKAVSQHAGFTAVAIDLNLDFQKEIGSHPQSKEIINFLLVEQSANSDLSKIIFKFVNQAVTKVLSYNPKKIACSLLTFQSQIFTRWFLMRLRQRAGKIPIVIGGSGIKGFLVSKDYSYCDKLLSTGLIDHYITGDGEVAFVEYLKDNFNYPGINSGEWQQLTDLEQFAFPDYTDYDFASYSEPRIPLTDSKGCVRACEFCDVIEHWQKYTYRSADSVFAEMLHQIKTHNLTDFTLRNSLINGNVREFQRLLNFIVDYNLEKSYKNQIKWRGYFIVRGEKQHPESLWQAISASNGTLWLGIESAIEPLRHKMGKKFSNQDIDYHLAMAQKYKIPLSLLMIVAYPTETLADWEFTKKWFLDRTQYAGNPVYEVSLSFASILPGTSLDNKQDEYHLKKGKYPSVWFNQNLGITMEQKEKYWNELAKICAPFQGSLYDLKVWEQQAAMRVARDHASEIEF